MSLDKQIEVLGFLKGSDISGLKYDLVACMYNLMSYEGRWVKQYQLYEKLSPVISFLSIWQQIAVQ